MIFTYKNYYKLKRLKTPEKQMPLYQNPSPNYNNIFIYLFCYKKTKEKLI